MRSLAGLFDALIAAMILVACVIAFVGAVLEYVLPVALGLLAVAAVAAVVENLWTDRRTRPARPSYRAGTLPDLREAYPAWSAAGPPVRTVPNRAAGWTIR